MSNFHAPNNTATRMIKSVFVASSYSIRISFVFFTFLIATNIHRCTCSSTPITSISTSTINKNHERINNSSFQRRKSSLPRSLANDIETTSLLEDGTHTTRIRHRGQKKTTYTTTGFDVDARMLWKGDKAEETNSNDKRKTKNGRKQEKNTRKAVDGDDVREGAGPGADPGAGAAKGGKNNNRKKKNVIPVTTPIPTSSPTSHPTTTALLTHSPSIDVVQLKEELIPVGKENNDVLIASMNDNHQDDDDDNYEAQKDNFNNRLVPDEDQNDNSNPNAIKIHENIENNNDEVVNGDHDDDDQDDVGDDDDFGNKEADNDDDVDDNKNDDGDDDDFGNKDAGNDRDDDDDNNDDKDDDDDDDDDFGDKEADNDRDDDDDDDDDNDDKDFPDIPSFANDDDDDDDDDDSDDDLSGIKGEKQDFPGIPGFADDDLGFQTDFAIKGQITRKTPAPSLPPVSDAPTVSPTRQPTTSIPTHSSSKAKQEELEEEKPTETELDKEEDEELSVHSHEVKIPTFTLFLSVAGEQDVDQNLLLDLTEDHMSLVFSQNVYFHKLDLDLLRAERHRDLSSQHPTKSSSSLNIVFTIDGSAWFMTKANISSDLRKLIERSFDDFYLTSYVGTLRTSGINAVSVHVDSSASPQNENTMGNIDQLNQLKRRKPIQALTVSISFVSVVCLVAFVSYMLYQREVTGIDHSYTHEDEELDDKINLEFEIVTHHGMKVSPRSFSPSPLGVETKGSFETVQNVFRHEPQYSQQQHDMHQINQSHSGISSLDSDMYAYNQHQYVQDADVSVITTDTFERQQQRIQ